MFQRFYGLREQPFGVTPDPAYLYFSATHREALASLFYGIESGCGFLALIAQPGMGKTTLLFHLLEKLGSSAQTVFLFQTQCGSREFFRYLLADLGAGTGEQDLASMHESLNAALLKNARMGRRVVLVIDEAQNLEDSVLETVRLLSDFETPREKLLQIVLCGQPQLATKLSRPGLAQLRQRISIIGRLHPFKRVETMVYIEYRLCKAGYAGPPLFGYDAVELIAAHSGGIPRNINNICFNALTLGCAKRAKKIDAKIVSEVLADLDLEGLGSYPTNVAPEMQDPLSTFDGLSPIDEPTYHELRDAVRAAWDGGQETSAPDATLGGGASSDPASTKIEVEAAPDCPAILAVDEAPAESALLSLAEKELQTFPAPRPGAPRDNSEHVVEAAIPGQPAEAYAKAKGTFATASSSSSGAGGGASATVQTASWASARFLAETFGKKKVGGAERRSVFGGRKLAVAMFALIGSGLLGVARHYGAAKSLQPEKSPAPSTNSAHVALPAIASSSVDVPRAEGHVEDEHSGQTRRPTPPRTPTMVTVEIGQTLGGVSLRYLGRSNPEAIHEIQTLNPEIRNPDLILAGRQIRLPTPASDSHSTTSSNGGDLNQMETQR